METNITSDIVNSTRKNTNHYSTVIPLYDTLEATEEEWNSLNIFLSDTHWVQNLAEKNTNEALDFIIDTIEAGVKACLRLKEASKTTNSEGKSFSSKNHIPRMVRSIFKTKARASKQLRKVKSVSRCLAIRRKIAEAENKLKLFYESWKQKKEESIIEI